MMPYILNIHTATETAIVNLSRGAETLATTTNTDTKEHAAFLHSAIRGLLIEEGISMTKIEAIGITSGPGSYTGMRVGLAAAKGFCYALHIPLITFNTLEVMAASCAGVVQDKEALYCPMIDARRMEVYTALYSCDLVEAEPPEAKILSKNSYAGEMERRKIYFCGSGSTKFQRLSQLPNLYFPKTEISSPMLSLFSWRRMQKKLFESPAYAQPFYIKEYYTG